MTWPLHPILLLSLVTLVTAGCGTSGEMRDYAKSSQTNLVLISTQLTNFADTRNRLAKTRADTLANWARAIATDEADQEIKRAAHAKAGDTKTFKAVYDILGYATSVAVLEARPESEAERARQKVDSANKTLVPPVDDMRKVQAKLADLAKEESVSDRLKFLFAFAKEVNADMEKARKTQKDAEGNASKLKLPTSTGSKK